MQYHPGFLRRSKRIQKLHGKTLIVQNDNLVEIDDNMSNASSMKRNKSRGKLKMLGRKKIVFVEYDDSKDPDYELDKSVMIKS